VSFYHISSLEVYESRLRLGSTPQNVIKYLHIVPLKKNFDTITDTKQQTEFEGSLAIPIKSSLTNPYHGIKVCDTC